MVQPTDAADEPTPLTELDYVAAKNASRHKSRGDYQVIKRDADPYGNVLSGLLYDGENYAFASRRDDCQVKGDNGIRRPHWSVKSAGSEIVIEDVSELERAYEDTEHEEYVLRDSELSGKEFVTQALDQHFGDIRGGWEIEDIGASSITLYDPNAVVRFTVEISFESGREMR